MVKHCYWNIFLSNLKNKNNRDVLENYFHFVNVTESVFTITPNEENLEGLLFNPVMLADMFQAIKKTFDNTKDISIQIFRDNISYFINIPKYSMIAEVAEGYLELKLQILTLKPVEFNISNLPEETQKEILKDIKEVK